MPKVDHFDWDDGNRDKCRKHGVSIAEIEAVLAAPEAVSRSDAAHSGDEPRRIAIGRGAEGRPIFVGLTERWRDGRILLRPITARYMHAKEARRYEALARDEDR